MISNLEKYKEDLDKLIDRGSKLYFAIQAEFSPDILQDILAEEMKNKEKIAEFMEELPSFISDYQKWYSESLVILKQLLPDRVGDFVAFYKRPNTARKSITRENYKIEDALQCLQVTRPGPFMGEQVIVAPSVAIPLFEQQFHILQAVKAKFESSLFDIKQLVRADLFDSELDVAKELNKKGFTRAAGAVAGVVLEGHLLQVCENHNIPVKKKNPGINDLAQLLKDNDVIETPEWRKIQHWADVRNSCGHKKKTEPRQEDIDELIVNVSKIIKTLF